jgi:hypothetical protein
VSDRISRQSAGSGGGATCIGHTSQTGRSQGAALTTPRLNHHERRQPGATWGDLRACNGPRRTRGPGGGGHGVSCVDVIGPRGGTARQGARSGPRTGRGPGQRREGSRRPVRTFDTAPSARGSGPLRGAWSVWSRTYPSQYAGPNRCRNRPSRQLDSASEMWTASAQGCASPSYQASGGTPLLVRAVCGSDRGQGGGRDDVVACTGRTSHGKRPQPMGSSPCSATDSHVLLVNGGWPGTGGREASGRSPWEVTDRPEAVKRSASMPQTTSFFPLV